MPTRFSDWWRQMTTQDRPMLVRLVVVGALGLGLLAFSGIGSSPHKTPSAAPVTTSLAGQEAVIGAQLTHILEAIPHVGTVSVAVTLDRTIQSQYVTSNQGLSSPSSSPVMVTNQQGSSVVPLDQVGPMVGGVVVVAKSANNPNIRSELAEAVQTLLQVQAYQVLILPN